MEIKRFFASPEDATDAEVVLRGGEFIHAVKVLRLKPGFRMIVCADGRTDVHATVSEIGADFLRARVDRTEPNLSETAKRFTLYQCVAKETDFIVRKAVELGVKRIVPVVSRYVNAETRADRLRKIVMEAAKQCGRAALTEVFDPIPFSDAVEFAAREEELILLPYERAAGGRVAEAVGDESRVGVFIGSEGGFSEDEVAALRERGAKIVSLGRRILRAETAAISALTLALDAAGELC